MESQPPVAQPNQPQPQKTEAAAAVPAPTGLLPRLQQFFRSPVAIVAGALVFGLGLLLGFRAITQPPQQPAAPTPTPTITPTPTPIRTMAPFATTSAFMTLDNAVSSFATTVKGYNTNDPSLSPPVLDLNLGF